MLLIAGSLLIRSAIQAVTADPGYDAARVIDAAFQFPEALRYSADRKAAITHDLLTRIGALPGVESVTSAQPPGFAFATAIAPADADSAAAPRRSIEAYSLVQAGYFHTVGIPLQFGRGFGADTTAAAHAVILSAAAARDLWPGQNPIGRHVRLGAIDEKPHPAGELVPEGATYDVVDVARDIRGVGLTPNDGRMIYLLRDGLSSTVPLLVRATSDPGAVLRTLPPAIAAVDPDVLVTTSTLADQLRQGGPFIVATLSAMVASTVGVIGLLLAVMGIYGTVSYIVARRTREVGIRMAIGAQRRDILTLVLRESARPVVIGLGIGIALAIGVSFVLRNVLYGVSRVDAVSFVGVSVLFLLIALVAAWPPARRATRVEPIDALRES